MTELLHKCLTKATTAEGNQMKRGPNWIFSRRAILKIFDDHLECGDWHIDYENITDAVLYSIRQMVFIPGYILKVETEDKTYHFGLNWGNYWRRDLPFPARREKAKIKHSLFSATLRIVLAAYIAYLLFQWFSTRIEHNQNEDNAHSLLPERYTKVIPQRP